MAASSRSCAASEAESSDDSSASRLAASTRRSTSANAAARPAITLDFVRLALGDEGVLPNDGRSVLAALERQQTGGEARPSDGVELGRHDQAHVFAARHGERAPPHRPRPADRQRAGRLLEPFGADGQIVAHRLDPAQVERAQIGQLTLRLDPSLIAAAAWPATAGRARATGRLPSRTARGMPVRTRTCCTTCTGGSGPHRPGRASRRTPYAAESGERRACRATGRTSPRPTWTRRWPARRPARTWRQRKRQQQRVERHLGEVFVPRPLARLDVPQPQPHRPAAGRRQRLDQVRPHRADGHERRVKPDGARERSRRVRDPVRSRAARRTRDLSEGGPVPDPSESRPEPSGCPASRPARRAADRRSRWRNSTSFVASNSSPISISCLAPGRRLPFTSVGMPSPMPGFPRRPDGTASQRNRRSQSCWKKCATPDAVRRKRSDGADIGRGTDRPLRYGRGGAPCSGGRVALNV